MGLKNGRFLCFIPFSFPFSNRCILHSDGYYVVNDPGQNDSIQLSVASDGGTSDGENEGHDIGHDIDGWSSRL